MKLDNCKNCTKYREAKKAILGFSGKTGTCLERAYPYNKVTDDGYCQQHEEKSNANPTL
jgi:hypothetical protein